MKTVEVTVPRPAPAWVLSWAAVVALLLSGCTAGSYRRSADQRNYQIIQQTEFQVLGRTNAINIDTPYSHRKPAEILPEELIEDRLRTNRHVLTVDAAIELAMQNSREYQRAKETLYLAALRLSNTRYTVGGRVTPSSVTTAGWGRDSSGDHSSEVITDTGVQISQLFKTGGRLTVNALNSIMLYYSGQPELSFSSVSATLVQPLLRGFGRNSEEVELLTQRERDMVYAVRTFSLFQDEFALGIANEYFRLLQQKDNIRNRYTNYLSQVESTKRLEARKDREKSSDVDQARQSELAARNNYINTVATYFNGMDQFKIRLGLPLSERLDLDDEALTAVDQTGLVPAAMDPLAAYRLAVQRQMQMLNFIDQFEDSKRAVRIAADKLKPGLTLTSRAVLESDRPTDYAKFDVNEITASAALQLDLPLDRLPRANAYREALIGFELQLRTFTGRLDALKNDIDRGFRTLEQRRLNYENQKSALGLANQRVESTTLLLAAGRSVVRDLVEAQNAQINAQIAVTAALVDYQETRLQLMLDIGALRTDSPQFWLKDHLASLSLTGAAEPQATSTLDQPVIPPDQLFEN
jgi:outer membrane protein TolC